MCQLCSEIISSERKQELFCQIAVFQFFIAYCDENTDYFCHVGYFLKNYRVEINV